MVRKLNVDGDAQADLAGHGGEPRAVFVYQMDSYHHWGSFLQAMISTSANLPRILLSKDLPMMRSVSVIDTALAMHCSK